MDKKQTQFSWFLLLCLSLIWGSSFILMKRGMYTEAGETVFTDTQVGSLRMAIASLVMLFFGIRHLRKITGIRQVGYLLMVGFFGNFFPAYLFTYAETGINSGLAGILNSFTSFFTVLIGFLFFRQYIIRKQVLGLLLAFAGICLLVGNSVFEKGASFSLVHIGAIVLATVMYAISLNTIKHKLQMFGSLQIASLSFTFLFIPSWIMLFATGTHRTLQQNSHAMESLGFIMILSVVGTCLALLIFNRVIALKSAVFASSVTYIIPVVAVLMGVAFNKEAVLLWQIAGMVVIVAGVYIANNAIVKKG